MINTYLFFICIAIFFLTFCLIFRYQSRKHKLNIAKATKVLKTVRSISGEYHEAKIFTYLRKISPYVFEELLLSVFEEQGYKVLRNRRYSHDGGIDGKVYKNGELYLIQAKRYKGFINPAHLKHFQLTIEKYKAKGGFFIHTGRTSKEQLNNFRNINNNVKILSGTKLIQFVKHARH